MTRLHLGMRPLSIKAIQASSKAIPFKEAVIAGTTWIPGPALTENDLVGNKIPFSYSAGKPCKSSGKIVHLPNEGPKYRR